MNEPIIPSDLEPLPDEVLERMADNWASEHGWEREPARQPMSGLGKLVFDFVNDLNRAYCNQLRKP